MTYAQLFYQTELLAKILVIKSSIGPDITEAYKSNDFRKLSKYCSVLKELLSLYEEYHEMTAKRWHAINKPFGFEGKDMYLGCVEARVKNAIRRLTDYINGDIERIEELELERVYYNGQENPLTESNAFFKIMTVGSFA